MQKIYCTINRVGNETKITSVVSVHVSGWPISDNECPLHVKAVTRLKFFSPIYTELFLYPQFNWESSRL